jgi:hypothetical protein
MGRSVFVVYDTMGSGRIVGVFDCEADALRVIGPFGAYHELHRCELNAIDPECLKWTVNEAQKAHLARLLGKAS